MVEGSDVEEVQVVLEGVLYCHGAPGVIGGKEYFKSRISGSQQNGFVFA